MKSEKVLNSLRNNPIQASIYLLKVNCRDTRTRCGSVEYAQSSTAYSSASIVNFEDLITGWDCSKIIVSIPFQANIPNLIPPENIRKSFSDVFWWFQGIKYGSFGKKWIKYLKGNITFLIDSWSVTKKSLFNPFFPNAPFLYSLKTWQHRKVFCCFQGEEKECIGNKWVIGPPPGLS